MFCSGLWLPLSAVSSGRSTLQDGDGSRWRTQTFDQCSSGFDLQQRPPWEEVAVLPWSPRTVGKVRGPCGCGIKCFSGPGRNPPPER